MAIADIAALAVLVGIVLAAVILAGRPLLARLAARNVRRRTSRVLIVLAGLLVGTAVISSSLVVGDTLSYIFLEDVYVRLGAIDEIVSNEFNGQLISFSEANATEVAADLAAWRTPIDGLAPTLLKVMPVRNVAGNKGNQQITVMGLDASRETAFGPLTARDGSSVTTDSLNASAVYANERAAAALNATVGQQLTLFYGTTNQTWAHATLANLVRDVGTAAYEHRSILLMDLRMAQAAFNESGAVNQIRVSNIGGVADGLGVADNVTTNLRLSIAIHHLDLRVHAVKADGIAQAVQVGRDATELFLVMGAFGILAGILLIVNIFVMLAEERKPELGIARALGFLRKDLLATFALEGTFYAVVAAALGSLAGVGLGYVMVYFFDKLVPHGQVPVTFHFDPSSVLTAFVAGTALTWATILVASWRVRRLNIVRAIRDLPEPGTRERSRDALAARRLAAAAGPPPEGEPRQGAAGPFHRGVLSGGETLPDGDDRRDVRAHLVHGHPDLHGPRAPGLEPRHVRAPAVRRLRCDRLHHVVRRDPELPPDLAGELHGSRWHPPRRRERRLERERPAGQGRNGGRESVV